MKDITRDDGKRRAFKRVGFWYGTADDCSETTRHFRAFGFSKIGFSAEQQDLENAYQDAGNEDNGGKPRKI